MVSNALVGEHFQKRAELMAPLTTSINCGIEGDRNAFRNLLFVKTLRINEILPLNLEASPERVLSHHIVYG